MLALVRDGEVVIYRRVGARLLHWRSVRGDERKIAAAIEAARAVRAEALASGGWAKVFLLGFEPAKPRHLRPVLAGVILEDDLDGDLGKV